MNIPQMHYDYAKGKLETSFKNSIEQLDCQLRMAQMIPSLSWYIFEVDNTPTLNFCNTQRGSGGFGSTGK